MIYADFHIHTVFSDDSQITPKTLVEQLSIHPFIKVVAVTDHGTMGGIQTVCRLASSYQDILIIPGVEITTSKGDVVILGSEKLPPKPWTLENVVDFARKTDSVSVAVHPFRELGLGEFAATSGLDAIEVLNGASSLEANRQASDLAKDTGLPGIAGSDSHRPIDLFSVHTKVQSSLNIDDILNAIKQGLVTTSFSGKSIRF